MTTKRREHFRARITMVPFSSWISMLVTSGSGVRGSSSTASSLSSSSSSDFEGRAAVIVPAAVRGLYRDHSEHASVAWARSVEAGTCEELERSFPVGVTRRRVWM